MTRIGRNDPNVTKVIPREQSCTAEAISLGLDQWRGNRPRLDVTAQDGRKLAVYLTRDQLAELRQGAADVAKQYDDAPALSGVLR